MALPPQAVAALQGFITALQANPDMLQDPQLGFFRDYITSLGGKIPPKKAAAPPPKTETPKPETPKAETPKAPEPTPQPQSPPKAAQEEPEEPDTGLWPAEPADTPYVAVPTPDPSAEIEWDEEKDTKGAQFKNEGVELMGSGDYPGAVTKLTEALKFCAHKAPFWAFRAAAYLKWKKPLCAIKDATVALKFNPENAKALRTRGQANRYIGNYEQANLDLNAANRVDYDDSTLEMIKFVDARAAKIRAKKRREDMAKEEAAQAEARRRQAEARAANEAARRAAEAKAEDDDEGMGGGMPGGMGGMPPGGMPPGMEGLFRDPDFMAAMQDPETAAKLQKIMSNPMAAMQYMNDPKIAALMQKMMAGMGGGMGGMPGMGGMGGMPGGMPPGGRGGFGGMPPGAGRGGAGSAAPPPQAAPKAAAAPPPPKRASDELD